MFSERDQFVDIMTPILYNLTTDKDTRSLTTSLFFVTETPDQTGLYELYLHNCEENPLIKSGQVISFQPVLYISLTTVVILKVDLSICKIFIRKKLNHLAVIEKRSLF